MDEITKKYKENKKELKKECFRTDLISILEKHKKSDDSLTPSFLLADYIIENLIIFNETTKKRVEYHCCNKDHSWPNRNLL